MLSLGYFTGMPDFLGQQFIIFLLFPQTVMNAAHKAHHCYQHDYQ